MKHRFLALGILSSVLISTSAHADEICTAVDNAARVLKSANPNDTHPKWLGESYVGTGAGMKPKNRVQGPGGEYILGDLYTTRGGVDTADAYFLAHEWDCEDQAATVAEPEKPVQSAAVGSLGKWRVKKDVNPIDDTQTVTLMLDAQEGSSKFGDTVLFVARCKSNATEAYIVWGDYLGNDSQPVTIRIGDRPAEDQRWDLSTDSQATFAPDWPGTLLKEMTSSNRLVAQTTPYNESPVTAIFDTTGLSTALAPLMDVCKWSL